MATFVGLDVSLKATSICVLDEAGTRILKARRLPILRFWPD